MTKQKTVAVGSSSNSNSSSSSSSNSSSSSSSRQYAVNTTANCRLPTENCQLENCQLENCQLENCHCRLSGKRSGDEDARNGAAPRTWYFCLALLLLMYVLLFLFRSYIPEPWTALIAIALLAVYRVLRHWLHPPVKRNRLLSSNS
jgi:hypothetical protein